MIIIIFNIIVTNTIVINNNEFSSVLTASEPTRRSDFTRQPQLAVEKLIHIVNSNGVTG